MAQDVTLQVQELMDQGQEIKQILANVPGLRIFHRGGKYEVTTSNMSNMLTRYYWKTK